MRGVGGFQSSSSCTSLLSAACRSRSRFSICSTLLAHVGVQLVEARGPVGVTGQGRLPLCLPPGTLGLGQLRRLLRCSVDGELYVVALAAAVMLTMDSTVVAVGSYDPFTDNAGGIVGMAELAHEVRIITDTLDAVLVGVVAVRVGVVMVILFRSLLVPIMILCTLPLAIVGAFVALTLTGRALDLSALIGLLTLMGIVVTNAIVLCQLAHRSPGCALTG
jgi:AcrB/AcrD/AcrF family/Inorganic H+ pyrophosphatase